MQTPYQNIGEATDYAAFITGADGHDKASILRRTSSPNLPDIPVLDDDGWQRLIYLIDAAPKLLEFAKLYQSGRGTLAMLNERARIAIDLATKGKQ
jgi:hypothetical protein